MAKSLGYDVTASASDFDNLDNKPTTLEGYGITNAYTIDQVNGALSIRDTDFTALNQEVGRRVQMGGGGLDGNQIRIGYSGTLGRIVPGAMISQFSIYYPDY